MSCSVILASISVNSDSTPLFPWQALPNPSLRGLEGTTPILVRNPDFAGDDGPVVWFLGGRTDDVFNGANSQARTEQALHST